MHVREAAYALVSFRLPFTVALPCQESPLQAATFAAACNANQLACVHLKLPPLQPNPLLTSLHVSALSCRLCSQIHC